MKPISLGRADVILDVPKSHESGGTRKLNPESLHKVSFVTKPKIDLASTYSLLMYQGWLLKVEECVGVQEGAIRFIPLTSKSMRLERLLSEGFRRRGIYVLTSAKDANSQDVDENLFFEAKILA